MAAWCPGVYLSPHLLLLLLMQPSLCLAGAAATARPILPPSWRAQPAAPLTLLKSPQARCMDGSQGGYYWQKAASDKETRWVVHLQGGGECASHKSCKEKLNTHLGSSKHFSSTYQPYNFASSNAKANPELYNVHHVFVPYCSQDLFSGTVTNTSDDTWNLYFSGHLILEAIIQELLAAPGGLKSADLVVLSGDSAGGIGVWINVDWLQSVLPHAKVVGAPIAGFYAFAYPYTGANHTSSSLTDFREIAWQSHVELWGSFLPASCVAALGPQHAAWCMLSNYSAPFVKAPMFVVEAQSDCVQLTFHDWLPRTARHATQGNEVWQYMLEWKANQSQGLLATMKDADGYFNPACYIHTEFTHMAPLINGLSYVHAFNKWLNGTQVRVMDDCGIMCNQQCSKNKYC